MFCHAPAQPRPLLAPPTSSAPADRRPLSSPRRCPLGAPGDAAGRPAGRPGAAAAPSPGMASLRCRPGCVALFAACRPDARQREQPEDRLAVAAVRGRAAEFGTRPGNFQNTPLMIDNVLYVSTPYNRVVALDAESGRELWSYESQGVRRRPATKRHRLRPSRRGGVAGDRRGQRADADLHEQPRQAHCARREDW